MKFDGRPDGRSATGRLAAACLRGALQAALLGALALPACSFYRDLDDIVLQPRAVNGGDPDVGDAGVTDGGEVGIPDGGLDAELPDATRFGDPDANFCNRLNKPCRDNAFYCALSFNDPGYAFACRLNDNAGIGVEGEPCTALVGDCGAGLDCVDWTDEERVLAADPRGQVCTPPCLIGEDRGCAPGDVCIQIFAEIPGIGYCAPGCDPYADDCAEGRCSVDPSYPERALLPRFRCLLHGGGDQKSAGSSCDPVLTETNGCPDGLLCYEAEADTGRYKCVAPCQSDGDCESGSCLEAQGEFGLRYCSLD